MNLDYLVYATAVMYTLERGLDLLIKWKHFKKH